MRNWLKKARGNRSRKEVAKNVGISESFYLKIETGERNCSVVVAKKVAKFLGFDWQKFYESEEHTNDKQCD